GDLLGDAPDHLVEVGGLPQRAIDGERNRTLLEMAGLARGMYGADHRGMVKTLADLPWLLLCRHAVLQIATRHVQPKRIAIDVIERVIRRDVCTTGFQRRDQLYLVVIVFRERRIGVIGHRAGRDILDRVGRLLEEKRQLARWVRAALDGMRGIIAADAIDAANGKRPLLASDRDGHGRDLEDRLDVGLRLRGAHSGRAARKRKRARCQQRSAIDGVHIKAPESGDRDRLSTARPECRQASRRRIAKKKGPLQRAFCNRRVRHDHHLTSAGNFPPLAASFVITCLCNQMFMVAESLVSPVYPSSFARSLRAARLESMSSAFIRSTMEVRHTSFSCLAATALTRIGATSTVCAGAVDADDDPPPPGTPAPAGAPPLAEAAFVDWPKIALMIFP